MSNVEPEACYKHVILWHLLPNSARKRPILSMLVNDRQINGTLLKIKLFQNIRINILISSYKLNEHTSRSRDRTTDITASCIDGNITLASMVSVAVVSDGLTSLLVMFAEKQQMESK